MKSYLGDFERFKNMLQFHHAFALSRFGDGELNILMRRSAKYPEFRYDPNEHTDCAPRERLVASFHYKAKSYYVGISCPNCVGEERFRWAKLHSEQDDEHLTWATLFVNSNYARFLTEIVPLFSQYNVVVVCNRSATPEQLSFAVHKDFRVGNNAWKNDRDIAPRLCEYVNREAGSGNLFLLCAGPLSCILAHELHRQSEANTYLDVGSTLDPFLFQASGGLTRRYLRGDKSHLQRTCVWA